MTINIAKTMIFPAAIRYQGELAAVCANLKSLDLSYDTEVLEEVTSLIKELQGSIQALESAVGGHADDQVAEARHACDAILPAMSQVRKYADALEGIVADDLWPLPTYQEMLYIK